MWVLHLAYKPVLSPNISPSVAPLSYTDNPLIMLPFQVQHRLSVLGFQIRSDKSLLFIIIQCIKTKTKQKQRSLTHRLKNKYVKVSPTLPLLSLSYILTPPPPPQPPTPHPHIQAVNRLGGNLTKTYCITSYNRRTQHRIQLRAL